MAPRGFAWVALWLEVLQMTTFRWHWQYQYDIRPSCFAWCDWFGIVLWCCCIWIRPPWATSFFRVKCLSCVGIGRALSSTMPTMLFLCSSLAFNYVFSLLTFLHVRFLLASLHLLPTLLGKRFFSPCRAQQSIRIWNKLRRSAGGVKAWLRLSGWWLATVLLVLLCVAVLLDVMNINEL